MTSPYTAQPPLRIELAWPDKALSQNARARSHWPRTNAIKAARTDAFWATRQAMGAQWGANVTKLPHDGSSDVLLHQVAHPPANYAYDRDGIDARLKSARDGIADAFQVDDKHFRPTGITWGEKTPGGCIIVTVEVAK